MSGASFINDQDISIRYQFPWPEFYTFCTVLIAASGILGYLLPGMAMAGKIKADYIPMAPGTAVIFILISIALLFKHISSNLKSWKTTAIVIIVITSLFSILELIGHIIGMDLNFEEAMVPNRGALNNVPIGLMSPATAIAFTFSGISFFILTLTVKNSGDKGYMKHIGGTIAFMVLLISFVFSLAYIYGDPLLYHKATVIPMALTTAIGFLFLSLAILTSFKNIFPVRFLVKASWRNYMLRYILPLSVVAVILGVIAPVLKVPMFNIHPALISAGAALLIILLTVAVATFISQHLGQVFNEYDHHIKQAAKELRESEELYRNLFETMAQGVVYQNAKGEIISANSAAEQILGLSIDQMKGRKSIDPEWKALDRDGNELSGDKHPAMIALNTGKRVENFIQGIYNPMIDDYIWILVNSVPKFKESRERPYQVFSTFLDITARHKAEEMLTQMKKKLEDEVSEKTSELNKRISELESFRDATIDRELRMEELRREIDTLKKQTPKQL